jgi:hypothetical protein
VIQHLRAAEQANRVSAEEFQSVLDADFLWSGKLWDTKFFYNMHPQTSGRVKGYRERVPPQVWYIAPGKRRRDFGLRQK